MVTPENQGEFWPRIWKETKAKAAGIISGLEEQVGQGPLGLADLSKLNDVISHLRGPWGRRWSNPLLRTGVGVIAAHFTRQFFLKPTRRIQYSKILDRAAGGYFEGKDEPDDELRAFMSLTSFIAATRKRQPRRLGLLTENS